MRWYKFSKPDKSRPVVILTRDSALEFLGEYANAGIGKGPGIDPSVPERMQGYWGQVNVHFLEDAVRKDSSFTGTARWDTLDTDLRDPVNDKERLTLGINFRPIQQTVFKLNYLINYQHKSVSTVDQA